MKFINLLSIYNSANAYGDYFPWLLYFFYWTVQFFFQLFNSAVIRFSFLFFFFIIYDSYFVTIWPILPSLLVSLFWVIFASLRTIYRGTQWIFSYVFSSSKFLPGREIWKQCHVLERNVLLGNSQFRVSEGIQKGCRYVATPLSVLLPKKTAQLSRPPSKCSRWNLSPREWISRRIRAYCQHSPPRGGFSIAIILF